MTASATCNICFSICPAEKFRILTCGHGYCGTCTGQISILNETGRGAGRTPRIACPSCREVVRRDNISKGIYLDFVDSKTATVSNVVEGMGRMDQDAPLASVNKAAEKLDRAAKASKGNVDMMSQLLQSIEDFKARIAPLFEKVRKQEEDLQAARREALRQLQDRQTLENRLVRASALRAENAQLRGQLATSNQVAEEMTVAGQQMKDEMLALQNELASYKKIASDLDVDKRRMADQLERNANAARTAKEKYKRAKQDNDELQKRLTTAEERQREAPTSPMSSQFALYQDYGDELGFKQPMSSQAPARPPPPIDNEFSWEGIARPGFGSDWQLSRNKENHGVLKKNRPVGGPTHRRVTNPIVPLRLNNKGQPTTAVHIGPKRNLRAF